MQLTLTLTLTLTLNLARTLSLTLPLARLALSDLEVLPFVGPFSDYYPEDSISAELLRLLPPTVRPSR